MVYSAIIQFFIQAIVFAFCFHIYEKQKKKIKQLEKEKKYLEEKVSRYWHKWRKSKKQRKELISFTDMLIEYDKTQEKRIEHIRKINSKQFSRYVEVRNKLSKFNRERDPITGKFKKKK